MVGRLRQWRRRRDRPEHYSMTLGEWIGYHHDEIVMKRCTWMGKQALKNPLDAWIYQEIIAETRPELIVELGTAYGGSTLFLAQMMDLIGSEGPVIAVDHSHEEFSAEHLRIRTVTGDTRAPETIDAVGRHAAGRRGMVIHDADHAADVVLEDLRNYSRFVAPDCYLIVEDGIRDEWPFRGANPPGPLTAIRRFLAEADEFEIDSDRERYLITYNPQGFLRRRAG
jgi:cephalosporin hydroxylase